LVCRSGTDSGDERLAGALVHSKIAWERLGHFTITTTFDLYSHVTETRQEDAAAKLDASLRSAITWPASGWSANWLALPEEWRYAVLTR